MLQFPDNYFDREERDDFCISELMKRAWASQLEVLYKIIEICERHGLTYYAYWGTLLGTIRHHGFIPWDDDLDIALKRDDYIRFLEVAESELPKGYRVINAYTADDYDNYFTRVTNGFEIDFSDERMQQYHDCPFAMGVDVFPLYYIPRDAELKQQQKALLDLVGLTTGLLDYKEKLEAENGDISAIQEYQTQIVEVLTSLEAVTGYHFIMDKPLKQQLQIVYDQICRMAQEEESDYLTAFPVHLMNGYFVEKHLIGKPLRMPFENIIINAPQGYDAILTKTFRDYMVPRKVRAQHDYPFFKEQIKLLGKHIEEKDLQWKIQKSASDLTNGGAVQTGEEILAEWQEKLYFIDEKGVKRRKKVILYYTGAGGLLCNSELVLQKLKSVFRLFQRKPEVALWWVPCFLDIPSMPFIKKMAPKMVEGYQQMIADYSRQNWGIFDDSGNIRRAIDESDAFYGDESEVSRLYQETGKWVMIQGYDQALEN